MNLHAHLNVQPQIHTATTLKSGGSHGSDIPNGCHIISAQQLSKLISSGQNQTQAQGEKNGDCLILDIRPFSEYSRGAITNALHICLPSTLMKRKNFTFEKLMMHMSLETQRTVKEKFNMVKNGQIANLSVVLYSGSTLNVNKVTLSKECLGLVTKLLDYEGVTSNSGKVKICVLSLGFYSFLQEFPQFTWCPAEAATQRTGNGGEQKTGVKTEAGIDLNHNTADGFNMPSFGGVSKLFNFQLSTHIIPNTTVNGGGSTATGKSLTSSSPASSSFVTATSPFFRFAQNEESMDIETYLSEIKSRDSCNSCTDKKLKVQLKYEKLLESYSKDEIDRCIPKWFQVLMSRDKLKFVEEFRKLDLIQRKRLNNSVSMASSFFQTVGPDPGPDHGVGVPLRRAISNRDGLRSGNYNLNCGQSHCFGNHVSRSRTPMPVRSASGPFFPPVFLQSPNVALELNQSTPLPKRFNDLTAESEPEPELDPDYNHNHEHEHEHDTAERRLPAGQLEFKSKNLQVPKQQPPPSSRSPSPVNHKWLRDIDSDLEGYPESDESSITIPCGFELGTKNRYKDIFPYEHTRVHLHRHTDSISSLSPTQSFVKIRSNSDGSSSSTCSKNVFNSESEAEEEEEEEEDDDNDDGSSGAADRNTNAAVISSNTDIDSYINANYLTLPELEELETKTRVRYIATQAPMLSTVHDFYTCVINDKVPLIIALTDEFEHGVERCFRYWKEARFGDIEIKVLGEENLGFLHDVPQQSKVILRRLRIFYIHNNSTRHHDVMQVQIKDWPDLGVLTDPIGIVESICLKQTLLEGLTERQQATSGTVVTTTTTTTTILVHCSAGCGRTGTWCTIDSILSNLNIFDVMQKAFVLSNPGREYDPVVWMINNFRKQRISMVQNINQFIFIYECLLYYFSMKLKDNRGDGNSFEKIRDGARNLGILQSFIEGY